MKGLRALALLAAALPAVTLPAVASPAGAGAPAALLVHTGVQAALLVHTGAQAAPVDRFPDVAAAYWVEVDGRPLWAGQADRRLPMASLAKLMTALLAVEQGGLDDWAEVSAAAAAATGTRLGLRRGERLTRRDLLLGALVRSANDACRALADDLGAAADARNATGAFVARMNARAAALGMADTHYANPCGHDDAAQYTTVRDLAVLSHAVMEQPVLTDAAQRRELRVVTAAGRVLSARTTNPLLAGLPGARGLKTGTTPAAGRCLVALAERDGRRVLVILLRAPQRWWDSVGLVELAFAAPLPRQLPAAGGSAVAVPDAAAHAATAQGADAAIR